MAGSCEHVAELSGFVKDVLVCFVTTIILKIQFFWDITPCCTGAQFSGFISVHSFLGAFAKLRKATISFIMSVRLPAWNNSPLDGFS